ncbi:glycine receptor subunit alpha-2-like [Ptychodera flava]|uniref:glycine receptor subunit alpha-2-like n=1 Tax=Ptychodera flava TaxID=63121 RepID=UPI00396A7DD3
MVCEKMTPALVTFLLISLCSCGLGQINPDKEKEATDLFDELLAGYDKRIRPKFGSSEPVENIVQVYLASFDDIEETKMSYSSTIYLRQQWNDPRLAYDPAKELPVSNYMVGMIWVPDLMFGNEKKANYHTMTTENKVASIDYNGTVQYSARISLTLHCEMDFHRFPIDKQQCGLEVESFQYTTKDLVFQWVENEPAEFNKNHLKLPQYTLQGIRITDCTRRISTGNYTCIGLTFVMKRELGYYLLQTYIPSILLTVLSWVSFWVDIKASPARVALGITSVLTMITTLNGVRGDLPHVSYVKAIDVWFAMCLVFVVLALIEYAIVHYLSSNKLRIWFYKAPESVTKEQHQSGDCCLTLTIIDKAPASQKKQRSDSTFSQVSTLSKPEEEMGNRLKIRGNCSRKPEAVYDTGKKIDYFCRIAFPVAFIIFNIGYWLYYTGSAEYEDVHFEEEHLLTDSTTTDGVLVEE